MSFVNCGTDNNLKLMFSYAYLVFRLRRPKALVTLRPSNTMLVQNAWNKIAKWVVRYIPSVSENYDAEFINNMDMSFIREARTTNSSAANSAPESQFRIEVVFNNGAGEKQDPPSWLKSPTSITTNASQGYDQQTGTINELSTFLDPNYKCLTYNGNHSTKVTLKMLGGSGGATYAYPFMKEVNTTKTYPMPSIATPAREGYAFLGFYDDVENGVKYYNANGSSAKEWDNTSDTATLYAHWSANTYTATFDKQGGSGGTDQVSLTYMEEQTSIAPPTRAGYDFGGYFAEKNGGGLRYYKPDGTRSNKWNIASDATLYAYWKPKTYAITLDPNGGSGGTTAVTATYGEPLPGIRLPTRDDSYYCTGYKTKKDGSSTIWWYTLDDDISVNIPYGKCDKNWSGEHAYTLYAQWEYSTTITWDTQRENDD